MKVTVTGDDPKQTTDDISDALNNRRGNVYRRLTQDVKDAINAHADKSYASSPAKVAALESCDNWQHTDGNHRLDVMSLDYANYRQYGCGGIDIAILVDITPAEIDMMADHIVEEVSAIL